MTPKRIQLKRTKGWRKPEGAIVVSRPSKWGNPYIVSSSVSHADAVELFRSELIDTIERPYDEPHALQFRIMAETITELRGHDLACWCVTGPCHADVLLDLANR